MPSLSSTPPLLSPPPQSTVSVPTPRSADLSAWPLRDCHLRQKRGQLHLVDETSGAAELHLVAETSGAAESNFRVVKRGGDSGGINDNASLRALGELLQHQETTRIAEAARGTEFGAVPHPSPCPSVPGRVDDQL